MEKIKVWDLPTRVFHWALFVTVLIALVTGDDDVGGGLTIHAAVGLAVLALLLFRLAWGLVGTRHARFASFVAGYRTVRAYGARLIRLDPPSSLGHNPLGGWMIVLILLDLAVVVGTGLFAGGEGGEGEEGDASSAGTGAFGGGPLVGLVSRGLAETLGGVHAIFANLLIALIVLHVLGVLADWLLTRDNLIRAMITGEKALKPGFDAGKAIRSSRLVVAIPLALAAIGVTCYIALAG